MISRPQLLADLQAVLRTLEADLLERSEVIPAVQAALRDEYQRARAAERTAQSYEDWRSDTITQVAAAWVLSGVFVRFLEDNRLIDSPRIAGPGERLERARDEHELYFRAHPTETDREYLLHVFNELTRLPGTKDIFGAHNPIHELPNWLSGDAAGELLRFFQKIDANTGALIHDFTDPDWNTRFLGDLYQDLSEAARKKYALLQTPEFVEEFILDRTLDPAVEEFGLEGFRMIDPACGSGHFLLGSFMRLLNCWLRKEPGTNVRELVQRALDSVHGVDVNPYAVAIARFRLLLVAMKACEVRGLANAPAFYLSLVCGDSLIHGSGKAVQQYLGNWDPIEHVYSTEDLPELCRILHTGRYHSVVANPPYITPKDNALNRAYRDRYPACYRKYSLAVPFMQRIFNLAVEGGFTGQITANSFMKREFGKVLVEQWIPRWDLTHIIDSDKAQLPGHATPTVIVFARHRPPTDRQLRVVMGIKKQIPAPRDPEKGHVWQAIIQQIDQPGSESEWVTIVDMDRDKFQRHPWSIGGGGAAELKELIDKAGELTLSELAEEIGVFGITGMDEIAIANPAIFRRKHVESELHRPLIIGDNVRDWITEPCNDVLFPYIEEWLINIDEWPGFQMWMWPTRTVLGNRATFSKRTYFQESRAWWEWHQTTMQRLRTPFTITFPFVSTHNHFVLDRGGKAFKQTSPLVKLPEQTGCSGHLRLLGLLNSSVGCFWMKQVCHDKGAGGIGGGIASEQWEHRFEFDSTKVGHFPVRRDNSLARCNDIDQTAQDWKCTMPKVWLPRWKGDQRNLKYVIEEYKVQNSILILRLISEQEELDWQYYRIYGLIDEDLTYGSNPPPIQLGQRAFEIAMAREVASRELETTWFERHGSTAITEVPTEWPDDYRRLVERRITLIETDRNIGLIDQPEYKRRWNTEPWESQLERALCNWLLDRLESYFDFDGRMNDEGKPTAKIEIVLTSTARLADVARQDADFMQVGELYRNNPAFDVHRLVADLVESESVPLLPVLRYQPSGLRKRMEWEQIWNLQRQEDTIDARTKRPQDDPWYLTDVQSQSLKRQEIGDLPVPPKYTNSDFVSSTYWRLRGKLDVPKERWVSFPHCEGADGTLMIAWAGYDHLQLARAISAYYVDIQERLGGRDDPRLVPLLACLIELLPWLKQWHNEVDPEFGMHMGDYFEGFLQEEARQMGKTLDQIRTWEPPKTTARRRKKSTT